MSEDDNNSNGTVRTPYNLDLINHLTCNIMKKYRSELELFGQMTNLTHQKVRSELTSRSVWSLPLVKVTGPEGASSPEEVLPKRTQSNPCSPGFRRKGFKTYLDGTQYIFGR